MRRGLYSRQRVRVFPRRKKKNWGGLGVGDYKKEGSQRCGLSFFFFFFPLLSLLIMCSFYCRHLRRDYSSSPVVSSTNCSRTIQKKLRSWSTLWVRPVMMSSLPAVATSLSFFFFLSLVLLGKSYAIRIFTIAMAAVD